MTQIKCSICEKELTLNEVVNISPYDFNICCNEHAEYKKYFQREICRALAGYSSLIISDEMKESFFNERTKIWANHRIILKLINEVETPQNKHIVNSIRDAYIQLHEKHFGNETTKNS